jgi:hypothetical protein
MNNLSKLNILKSRPFTLEEYKIQAQILLKNLNSANTEIVSNAKNRFINVAIFTAVDDIQMLAKLKHALAVIAIENGFDSWLNLKTYFDKTRHTNFIMHSGFLNQWFSTYKDAKSYLTEMKPGSSFLLPFKKQFFICDANVIEHFGFNPHDQDWQLINYNWVEPNNIVAWERLNNAYRQIKSKQNTGGYHG